MKLSKNKKLYLRLRGNVAFPALTFGTKTENFVFPLTHTRNIVLVRKRLRHSRGFLFIKW